MLAVPVGVWQALQFEMKAPGSAPPHMSLGGIPGMPGLTGLPPPGFVVGSTPLPGLVEPPGSTLPPPGCVPPPGIDPDEMFPEQPAAAANRPHRTTDHPPLPTRN